METSTMVKERLRSDRMLPITKVIGASQGEARMDLPGIEGTRAAVVKGVFSIAQRRADTQHVLTTMKKGGPYDEAHRS